MFTLRYSIYLSLILAGIIIGLARSKKLSPPFMILLLFLATTLASEIGSRIFAYTIRNSSPVYHFYVLLSASILSLLYFTVLKDYRKLVFLLYFLFVSFSVINSVFFQDLMKLPSNAIIASDILYIIYCLLLYKYLLDQRSTVYRSIISLNTIIMIYFSLQLFTWGFYNYLLKNHLNSKLISDIGYWINLAFYGSLAVLLIVVSPKQEKLQFQT
jgi:hypothetical protein